MFYPAIFLLFDPKLGYSGSLRKPQRSCFRLEKTTFLFRNVYTRIKDDIFMGLFPPKIKKKESIILHKHRDPCQKKKKKATDPESKEADPPHEVAEKNDNNGSCIKE